MRNSTVIALSMATFAFGYLQAMTSQGSTGASNHPAWVMLAIAAVILSLLFENTEPRR